LNLKIAASVRLPKVANDAATNANRWIPQTCSRNPQTPRASPKTPVDTPIGWCAARESASSRAEMLVIAFTENHRTARRRWHHAGRRDRLKRSTDQPTLLDLARSGSGEIPPRRWSSWSKA
jgi:hypothetical protein